MKTLPFCHPSTSSWPESQFLLLPMNKSCYSKYIPPPVHIYIQAPLANPSLSSHVPGILYRSYRTWTSLWLMFYQLWSKQCENKCLTMNIIIFIWPSTWKRKYNHGIVAAVYILIAANRQQNHTHRIAPRGIPAWTSSADYSLPLRSNFRDGEREFYVPNRG